MPGNSRFPRASASRVATASDALDSEMSNDETSATRSRISRTPLRRSTLPAEPARAGDLRDQRDGASRGRLHGRSHRLRLQGGVPAGARVPRPDRVPIRRRDPERYDSRNCRLRPLRGALRRAQLGAEGRGLHGGRDRLEQARPRQRARPGAGATAGSRSSSTGRSWSCACSRCTITYAPGTSRERNVVYDAATRSSASSAPTSISCSPGHKHVPYAWRRGHLRRECGNGLRRCVFVARRAPATT